jgi:hypothetical protein
MSLSDNLLHYYTLDETTGTREDSHGTLDLSVTGTVGYEAGLIGNQATFGSGDNLLQSSSEVYSANGDMSISAWITPNETSRGDVIGKSGFFKIGFGITSSKWYALANFSTTNALVESGTGFASGTRRHIVATYTASSKTVELFVDGTSVGTSTGVGTKLTSTHILFIGAERETTGSTIYNDSISDVDEVGIWSRVLTSDDITALYNSGNGLEYPFPTNQNITLTAETGTLTLTGYDATLGIARTLVAETGNLILRGYDAFFTLSGWQRPTKNTTTWTDQTKNSTTWTDQTKNSTTWDNQDRN